MTENTSAESPTTKGPQKPSRRNFLKYTVAGVAVAGVAAVAGSAYYKYSYQPSLISDIDVAVNTTGIASSVQEAITQLQLETKNGLNIHWSQYPDPAAMTSAFVSGRGTPPFGFGFSVFNVIVPSIKGLPLRVIGGGISPTDKILVRKDSGIKSPKDLENSTVGAFSATPILIWTIAKTYNIPLKSMKTSIGPSPVLVKNLLSGDIKAAELVEPFASQAVASGQVEVLADFPAQWEKLSLPPLPIVNVIVSWEDQLKALKDKAIKLNSTIFEALSSLRQNIPLIQSVYTDQFKLPANVAELAAKETAAPIIQYTWNDNLMEKIKSYLSILVELGVIEGVPQTLLSADYVSSSAPGIR